MKVITIKQPYASLIAEGLKEYEFRTWKTNYRGKILIHAGKGVDKEVIDKFDNYNLEYPSGCIIAEATLCDCVKVDDKFKKMLKGKNQDIYCKIINTKNDYYAFVLNDIKKVTPINVKGQLSIWEYKEY